MNRKSLLALAGLAVAAPLVTVGIATVASPADHPTPLALRDRHANTSRSVFYFNDLPTMLATSHVVVRGRVTEVRVVGEGGADEAKYDIQQVTLAVDEVFVGNPGQQVNIEEDGVETAYSLVGDEGTYFLVQRQDRPAGIYRLVNFQGRYLRDRAGELQHSGLESDLVARLEGLTSEQLSQEIMTALPDVRSGQVKALEP